MKAGLFCAVVALSATAMNCVSYAPPTLHLASAMSSAQAAAHLGAAQLPLAALHLTLAQEELSRANDLVREGENEKADYMTLRAYNDAELSIALTREAAAQGKAADASEKERNVGSANP